MNIFKLVAITFAFIVATPLITTFEASAGDLVLEHPWVRIMPAAAKVGAGYVIITNKSDAPDHLMSATSPAAEIVEIHEMTMIEGIMRMRPLNDGLAIPAGATVELKPGSYHIMFKKVSAPFKKGTMVPVTLNFMNAGAVEMEFYPATRHTADNEPMEMEHSPSSDMSHDESHGDMKPKHEGDDQ